MPSGSTGNPGQLATNHKISRVFSILLQNSAQVNAADNDGMTALHAAADVLSWNMLTRLIGCGANVNQVDRSGSTALHRAVSAASGKVGQQLKVGLSCIQLLLMHGAKINTQDREGQAAIHMACFGGREKIIYLLLNSGANVNLLTVRQESALYMFLQCSPNVSKKLLLNRLLQCTYPLRLTNDQGRLPEGLMQPEFNILRKKLIQLSHTLLSLKDICKISLLSLYGERHQHRLKALLPKKMYQFVYGSKAPLTS